MKTNLNKMLLIILFIFIYTQTITCDINEKSFAKPANKNVNQSEKKKTIKKIIVKVNKREDIFKRLDDVKKKIDLFGDYDKIELKYGKTTEIYSRKFFENNIEAIKKHRISLSDKNSKQKTDNTNNELNFTKKLDPFSTKTAKNNNALKDNNASKTKANTSKSKNKQTLEGMHENNDNNPQIKPENAAFTNTSDNNVKKVRKSSVKEKEKPNHFAQITKINVLTFYLQRIDKLKPQKVVSYPVILIKKESPKLWFVLQDSAKV
jgi:hypothetical protein